MPSSSLRLVIEYPCENGNASVNSHENGDSHHSSSSSTAASNNTRTVRYRVIQCSSSTEQRNNTNNSNSLCTLSKYLLIHVIIAWMIYVYSHYSLTSPPSLLFIIASLLVALAASRFVFPSKNEVYEESILLIPGLGIQLESAWYAPTSFPSSASSSSSSSSPPLRRVTRQFIEMARVNQLLINEGIQGSAVRFYLLLLVQQLRHVSKANAEERIILPFDRLQPRYPILLQIYQDLKPRLSKKDVSEL